MDTLAEVPMRRFVSCWSSVAASPGSGLRARGSLLLVVPTLILMMAGSAAAGPLFDFATDAVTTTSSPIVATLGWRFDVDVIVLPLPTITALGIFDIGANGLANSHEIGLWMADGTLLASVTITNGNSVAVASTSCLGAWRVTPITPFALSPEVTYVIGATYLSQDADAI